MIPLKPSNVTWTDAQWEAIYDSGKNILVSAGAGSGKTAVLTTRIIEKLKAGVKLENLIVLTFTKAAANEMKDRVRKNLNQEILKGNLELKAQLDYLDQANIQTFDGFALGLVKKYHYVLNMNRDIGIGDEALFKIKKQEILTSIFDKMYSAPSTDFKKLIEVFCTKNDEWLKNSILRLQEAIELLVDANDYLDNYADYLSEDFIECQLEVLEKELKQEVDVLEQILSRIKYSLNDMILIEHIQKCEEVLHDYYCAKSYDDFASLTDVLLPSIPRKVNDEDEKEAVRVAKEQAKKVCKKIKSICIYTSKAEIVNDVLNTKPLIKIMASIIKEVNERLFEYKKQINSFDFSDIAKMAISLVRDNFEIRNYLKTNINEILIDEYQDTNDIQETLIGYIANNNVYMVGDVKQSIYRFRNANPKIFMEKYQKYQVEGGRVIDLSNNFRSRSEVIDAINTIFLRIMDINIGGANYSQGHQLIFGNKKYELNKTEDNTFENITYEMMSDDYSKVEAEAIIVAEDIKNKMKNGYKVFDNKLGKMRKATFSDFAILTAVKKNFDIYRQILEFYKIPTVVHRDESFLNSTPIIVIKNIFKCLYYNMINCTKQDEYKFALISVLRSFVICCDDTVIDQLFTQYSLNITQGLKLLCDDFYNKVSKCAKEAKNSNLSEIFALILEEFEIYSKIRLLSDVEAAEERINHLSSQIDSLSTLGYNIKEFIDYLEASAQVSDIKYQEPKQNDANGVTIMNIHKSKGLEFNVCYFIDLEHTFNTEETKERVLFHKDLGIIIPIFQEGLKDTIYKKIFALKTKQEIVSEQIRLFYVALTRAKDKMIFVSPYLDKNNFNDEVIPESYRLNAKSFHDFLALITNTLEPFTKYIQFVSPLEDYRDSKMLKKTIPNSSNNVIIKNVTLKKQQIYRSKASASPHFVSSKDKEMMNMGIYIHKILQLIDFTNIKVSFDKIKSVMKISDQISKKIIMFFENDLWKQDIINYYRELEFYTIHNENSIHGIIDLVLETQNKYIIIDYKLYNLEKQEYVKQLETYKAYLEQYGKPVETYLYSIVGGNYLKIH